MTSYLLAGPAEEPVSLAEAKAFLKVDDIAEDALISTLIGAARLHIEGVTSKALLAQSWRLVLDNWPEGGVVKLPVSPLLSVTGIAATDENGGSHDIALAQFLSEPVGWSCRPWLSVCQHCAPARGWRSTMSPDMAPSPPMCPPICDRHCWAW